MFDGSTEPTPYMLHAYSHCNTLSSAAMTYVVTGEPKYLEIIVNAYEWFQRTQCFATGGYGPSEMLRPPDGSLGRSLKLTASSFETPCGSWAGFKLAKYLMQFTGEAKYGDWIEKLVYNGIGAALPMSDDSFGRSPIIPSRGQTFYYADYQVGAGRKAYHDGLFPCCSGTYPQALVEYHDLIYFKDPNSLYVNLFVPSNVTWNHEGIDVTVEQDTGYPETETVTLRVDPIRSVAFSLKLRVPQWSEGMAFEVNGEPQRLSTRAGSWAGIDRRWKAGDVVRVTIPMRPRLVAVDQQNPNRVAVMVGPVVLVREDQGTFDVMHRDPSNWLKSTGALEYRVSVLPSATFTPFYRVGKGTPYAMYLDLQKR